MLRTLIDERPRKALDIGCGYGPLGLALKAADPSLELHMVDRDALALHYAAANAVSNDLDSVEVYRSLGYDDVGSRDFDLIVMNIPAKSGERAIEHFLTDAQWRLAPGGKVAVVAVSSLEPLVSSFLDRAEVEVELRRGTRAYAAFHYRYKERGEQPPAGGFERGIYQRGRLSFSLDGVSYGLTVAHDLPEFDNLSFSTELVAQILGGATHSFFQGAVLFRNPGQGHLPVLLSMTLEPKRIYLVDRDLLALRVSETNLLQAGFSSERIEGLHSVDLSVAPLEVDLVVDLLRPKEPSAAVLARLHEASGGLGSGATLVLSGPSTGVTRAIGHLDTVGGWALETRVKKRGHSAVRLKRIR